MNSKILTPALLALILNACGQEALNGGATEMAVEVEEPAAEGGDWRRKRINGQPALVFGKDDANPLAALRCDAEMESLFIDRSSQAAAGAERMTIRVDGRTARLPVAWDGASPPTASAMVKLEDRLADGLTRLSGDIEIELGEAPPLKLPTDRRIGTLVEECRQS